MASACTASSGTTSASTARMPSVLHEAARTKNTAETRRSTSPERSSATSVFSNAGGAGSAASAATSARWRGHALDERREEVLLADSAEGGVAERQGAGREERVGRYPP